MTWREGEPVWVSEPRYPTWQAERIIYIIGHTFLVGPPDDPMNTAPFFEHELRKRDPDKNGADIPPTMN